MAAPFDNLIICVASGSFTAKVRTTLIEELTEGGACCVENVNPRVQYIVCASDDKTELLKTARQLNITTVTEEWVEASIEEGSPADIDSYNTFPEGPPKKRVAKRKAKTTATTTTSSSASTTNSKGKQTIKVLKKGRTVVDTTAPSYLQTGYHVYEEGNVVYDAMLNLTDIAFSQKGHNKFYAVQLLESDGKTDYCVFTRWGRVGAKGQSKPLPCKRLAQAKSLFEEKFADKSGNQWDEKDDFKAIKGYYTLVERDYDDDDGDGEGESEKKPKKKAKTAIEPKKSGLDERVQEFVSLICNLSMMQQALVEMEIDVNRMPLGKLKKSHVQKGYLVLKKIEQVIGKLPLDQRRLVELANKFYSLIPHNFGMSCPPPITTQKLLKQKIELLEALSDIEIATTLLKNKKDDDDDESPVDKAFTALNIQLLPVDNRTEEWKMVDTYIRNTHAPTHKNYTLKLSGLFSVKRPGEDAAFQKYAAMPNQRLLWHGSRMTNFVGILSQGLRIAPPEAPVTGYMFGKGIYFADLVSKSANYCHASKSNPTGVLLLSRVALGRTYDCTQAEYMDHPPAGYDSTKGVGTSTPDDRAAVTLPDGCTVPCGKLVPVQVDSSLLYNEFIVYDIAQCLMSYIVVVKFHFK